MKSKLLFITLFTTLICVKAISQTKNDWVISIQGSTSKLATSSGTLSNSMESGTKVFEINPSVDYFLNENIWVGAGLYFSWYNNQNNGNF